MNNLLELSGRILLSLMFLTSGLSKIGGYAATQGYMESQGVPGMLLPLVIALEVLAPAVLFHANFGDQMQVIMFMKNISIAGGFLLLAANGAGAWSLDQRGNR
jgi:putative oxidoreductase